jgi:hypothetical protein
MDKSVFFTELRKDINNYRSRIAAARTWSIMLAGAAAAACLRTLTEEFPVDEGTKRILSDPILISSIIIAVCAVLNFAFWTIAVSFIRPIHRVGTYLCWIEEKEGHREGWEHWVLKRYVNGQSTPGEKLIEDVQFWIAVAMFASSVVLFFFKISDSRFALVFFNISASIVELFFAREGILSVLCSLLCVLVLTVGTLRKLQHQDRRVTVLEASEHLTGEESFNELVSRLK